MYGTNIISNQHVSNSTDEKYFLSLLPSHICGRAGEACHHECNRGDFQDEILMAFGIDDYRPAVRVHNGSISFRSFTCIYGTRIMGDGNFYNLAIVDSLYLG